MNSSSVESNNILHQFHFSFSAAIAEMLVQSTVKDLYLLPALPRDKWVNGCVKGLKARGGVAVNICWEEGGLHEVGLWLKNHNSFGGAVFAMKSLTTSILSPIAALSLDFTPSKTRLHDLSTKLASNNYLLWKAQVVPILRGHGLLGYVTDEVPCPELTIVDVDGALQPNPAATTWLCIDQLVLGWINSSLSDGPLSQTSTVSLVIMLGLFWRLFMEVILGKPMDDDDLIICILHELGSKFDPIVAALNARDMFSPLEGVIGKLRDFEIRLQGTRASPSNVASFTCESRNSGRERANHKGYCCLEPHSSCLYISRHVRFNEQHFPFKNVTASHSSRSQRFQLQAFPKSLQNTTLQHSPTSSKSAGMVAVEVVPTQLMKAIHSSVHPSLTPLISALYSSSPASTPPNIPQRTHQMVICTQTRNLKPKVFFFSFRYHIHVCFLANLAAQPPEPTSYR
ncbi:hypothetical protein POTOM_060514 [Populus tomentosa]|uniref:Retrotransposon Copia-like N-terminal domain-containing protein n=1 Tax=Populus tomentosa TaxID=118781 RepID=A0A8X8BVU4_POPTO|nr:hypothetical protein POTOM_060514 [Populus tomentosa]